MYCMFIYIILDLQNVTFKYEIEQIQKIVNTSMKPIKKCQS